MAFFRVLIEGSGFAVRAETDGTPIHGFFVSRIVWALSNENADSIVKRAVADEWGMGRSASLKATPTLATVEITRVSVIEALFAKRPGYAFHAGE